MRRKNQQISESGDKAQESSGGKTDSSNHSNTTIKEFLGFEFGDFTSWQKFVRLMCRPTDPANLGVLRILFGLLMVIDIPQERGLSMADSRWGVKDACYFPLFNFLKPLPLEWMMLVYFVMLLGAIGIMVGYMFRFSCLLFVVPYWYIFLLDKTSWNNHSYLYGLLGILFLMSDANRYWSLDGIMNPALKNTHIPLWNYTLFRTQIFLVYFIAGLKKLDTDWTSGYSMQRLSRSYIFDPFRMVLTDEQIDLIVVHYMGLTLDLFMGFLLFFNKTRPVAFFFGGMFHLMNSQLFSIGMFPYAMLATLPLFSSFNWPRKFFSIFPRCLQFLFPEESSMKSNNHCLYEKDDVKSEDSQKETSYVGPTKAGCHHRVSSLVTVVYITIQLLLPYSHNVTKGYNNWTNGLYGYSWDMMVHSWSTQHIRITYIDLETNEEFYLDPQGWTLGLRSRWASHGDMVKQYAHCIEERLAAYNITNIQLTFDVWMSLNKRFQQRMFDPNVDVLTADWSPFSEVSFIKPLLVDLSDWRGKLAEIQKNLHDSTNYTDLVFVADFPGLHLENYIQSDLGNTTITLLKGEVIIEVMEKNTNFSLKEGDMVQVPSETFHKVHTVSSTPSCYMYIYVNVTKEKFYKKLSLYQQALNASHNGSDPEAKLLKEFDKDPHLSEYKQHLEREEASKQVKQRSMLESFTRFLSRKYRIFNRSVMFVIGAVRSILFNQPFEKFVEYRNMIDHQSRMKESAVLSTP